MAVNGPMGLQGIRLLRPMERVMFHTHDHRRSDGPPITAGTLRP